MQENRERVGTKDAQVKRMFESIAFSYDFQNSFLSLGQDMTWRRTLARSLQLSRGGIVLDLATGTAELAMAICTRRSRLECTVGTPCARESQAGSPST